MLMAVRSGAGTGVVVSLVVFILTTVFLLVLTIVFYAGKTREMEERAKADAALAAYVKPQQRSSDLFKGFESAAKNSGQSVSQYLSGRYESVMSFVGSDASGGVDGMKTDFARFNLKDTDTLRSRMGTMNQDLNARQTEVQSLKDNMAALNSQIAEKEAQLEQAKKDHQTAMDGVENQIKGYRDSADEYRRKLEEAIDELNRAKDTLRARYESELGDLRNESDALARENGILKGKIDVFESKRADSQMRGSNPAMLVDGSIIDAPGSSDQVFIDRGKKDRIVLGMTFEVYGDKAQIRLNPQTGELPRGKASLQVTKVSDTTATCKVTRSVTGQPLIRGDVVANAVYDPNYRFKFLVHGKFDIDADSKPTETEAEYLRSLVLNWGGTVVDGETLPGDLDFLVLGAEPPRPVPPPDDASAVVIADFIKKNEANAKYNELFRQAREAQIPVLNANRFFILIGHTDR
jgi:hypothetical protein